jgi:flagellar hook-basal body complex protein FliE
MSAETIGTIGRSAGGMSPEAATSGIEQAAGASGVNGFADTLGSAIQKVDELQVSADVQAERVALGGGNLHEMALALEKADVGMRLAMKVRNKLVDAYQEIMRMGI